MYEITDYDLTYIGCIDSMTLYNYKDSMCVRLKNMDNSFCRGRLQPSYIEDSAYYTYIRVWDESQQPALNYGSFNITNFTMSYGDYY